MAVANNMDRDQAPRNVGPDLRSILFDTRHQNLLKTSFIAWDDLNSEAIEIVSILQIVPEYLEDTVYKHFTTTHIHSQRIHRRKYHIGQT